MRRVPSIACAPQHAQQEDRLEAPQNASDDVEDGRRDDALARQIDTLSANIAVDPHAMYFDGVSGMDEKHVGHEAEDRFFDVSIDMLCVLDFSGYFKRLSAAWERTLGFTREELQSKRFIEFVHPDDRERTLNQNGDVRTGGQALSFENRYLCKDGSYRWLLWNAAPDLDQRVIYAVARDVTERRRAEEERERLLKELQAALAEVKILQAILPICSYCKRIRSDGNYWESVEAYITQHTNTKFTHGICPSCYKQKVEPQFAK